MEERRKVVRVFLGSPGDLNPERSAAKAAVDEINDQIASNLGYHVELVRWENVVASFGRPQGTINKELERCELFLGMIWKRWGSPPAIGGKYTSGFHEEYSISCESCAQTGKPEVSLFFKDVDPAQLDDPGDELKRVLEFKNDVTNSKTVIYERFAGADDLAPKLRRCITQYLFRLHEDEKKRVTEEAQTLPAESNGRPSLPATTSQGNTPLSPEGSAFLRSFIDRMDEEHAEPLPEEIARVRLLGSVLSGSGNDEQALGVHDANLLYLERDSIEWGRAEIRGLINAGCEHFSSGNIPLWCWVAKFGGFDRPALPVFSLFGGTDKVTGALQAMRLLGEPLYIGTSITRDTYLKHWFRQDAPSSTRAAALEYLGDYGQASDLPAIQQELDRKDYQTSGEATVAITKIELRQSRHQAMKAIFSLQPETVSPAIAEEVFGRSDISDDDLITGLSHKSSTVRFSAARHLATRGKLTQEKAEPLLSDASASIRLEALVALHKSGGLYPPTKARSILVKPNPGGLFGALPAPDREGERAFADYKRIYFTSLRETELNAEAATGPLLEVDAYLEWTERDFGARGSDLRLAIGDQFAAVFAREFETLKRRLGDKSSSTLEGMRQNEPYYRNNLTRASLSVLCRRSEPSDLALVRATLQAGRVSYADEDIEYLAKHGEWQDIELIVAAAKQSDGSGASLLAIADTGKYSRAARAIYRIGHKRLLELLELKIPTLMLELLIQLPAERAFKTIPDAILDRLLHSPAVGVRKTTVLKCIRHLPRRRLSNLLALQLEGDQARYYNVAHWLDLGLSAPRDRMLIAAQRELERISQAKW